MENIISWTIAYLTFNVTPLFPVAAIIVLVPKLYGRKVF
jgi:hypothetical protein